MPRVKKCSIPWSMGIFNGLVYVLLSLPTSPQGILGEHCILVWSTCLYSKQVSRMTQHQEWKGTSNTFGRIQRYVCCKGLTSVTYFPVNIPALPSGSLSGVSPSISSFQIIFSVDHFKSLYWIRCSIVSVLWFGFWLWGMWDLNSPTRDQTSSPCVGGWSHNHWTTRKVPIYFF